MMGEVMAKSVSYAQWSLEPYCIGMKLRALRTRKRLTLSRLAYGDRSLHFFAIEA
jgi:hypothetical protein